MKIHSVLKSIIFFQALWLRDESILSSCFAFQHHHQIHTTPILKSLTQLHVTGSKVKVSSSSSSSSSNVKSSSPSSSTSFFPFDNAFSPMSLSATGRSMLTTTSNTKITTTNTVSTDNELSTSSSNEYKQGLAIIGFITLMFSSNSPVLHSAFVNSSNPPSVLLLNAFTSCIALVGLISFGPILDSIVPLPSVLQNKNQRRNNNNSANNMEYIQAGCELGFWKTLGTTANLYGLSLTSSNHAAFLIQLTTLIVPSVQGLMGVPVPKRIWTSIALALGGIYLFTQDLSSSSYSSNASNLIADATANKMLLGDVLCVIAAAFYATYDLRLFSHGKHVPPLPLIRTKIAIQALLSCIMLSMLGEHDGLNESVTYVQDLISSSNSNDLLLVGSAVIWSGFVINAIVPFLQVSGQQIIGASRAQVVYASQPLWASILSFFLLGETLSENGIMGGMLFLSAIFLAASAESPDADCGVENCEV